MKLIIKKSAWNPLAICQVFTSEGVPVPLDTPLSEMPRYGICYWFSATKDILLVTSNDLPTVGNYHAPVEDGDNLIFEVNE